jgi:hypothetical protein
LLPRSSLVGRFVEHDFLSITFPERTSFNPDETCTEIILINSTGQSHTVSRWAADPRDGRFQALYDTLLELEQRAEGIVPQYEGPLDHSYIPE